MNYVYPLEDNKKEKLVEVMEIMCDCIERIKKKIKNDNNAVHVHIDGLKLRTAFKSLTKQGVPAQRWRNSSERFKFCPFCGKKYGGT